MNTMVIQSLYTEYFQKSRTFLYPALGIKRGGSITPIETYTSWKGQYGIEEAKLCCLYHLRDDAEFKAFEKHKLIGNKLFHDFKQVEENKAVYIFDFMPLWSDWSAVINGKYSNISKEHKNVIRNFIGMNSPNLPYIDSFLFPERYFKMYAEMMMVEEKVLREVGELCSVPNLELETLTIPVMDLQLQTKSVS